MTDIGGRCDEAVDRFAFPVHPRTDLHAEGEPVPLLRGGRGFLPWRTSLTLNQLFRKWIRSTPSRQTGARPLPVFVYTGSMRAQNTFDGTICSIFARDFSNLVGVPYFSKAKVSTSVFWRFIDPHLSVHTSVRTGVGINLFSLLPERTVICRRLFQGFLENQPSTSYSVRLFDFYWHLPKCRKYKK